MKNFRTLHFYRLNFSKPQKLLKTSTNFSIPKKTSQNLKLLKPSTNFSIPKKTSPNLRKLLKTSKNVSKPQKTSQNLRKLVSGKPICETGFRETTPAMKNCKTLHFYRRSDRGNAI
jgi:hypothetical protein